jgi:hypothetical protein
MNWHSYYTDGPNKRRRKAIPATCGLHRGPIGFANLLVSMQDGTIIFDPHVTGACVIALDEESAMTLRDTLTEWLGRTDSSHGSGPNCYPTRHTAGKGGEGNGLA